MKNILKLTSLIIFILLILVGCGRKETNVDENGFLTKIEWVDSETNSYVQTLKIGVEQENYDGDNIKAGIYIVKQTNTSYDEKTERIYNIFVSSTEYHDIDDVPFTDWQGVVGGYGNKNEIEVSVTKGQYVYIQTNNNGDSGYLQMELKK